MEVDLVIRGGKVLTEQGVVETDLAVEGGRIVSMKQGWTGSAREELRADGLHVFPGVIDSHVHFNEPGRTEWEGFDTGSAALAAGGGTCFFDMPLNSSPPVLNGREFDAKVAAARASSRVDFAIWGGLTPDSLDHLEELAARGVVGFKAFMSNSGIDEFDKADPWTLEQGMARAAKLGLPVAVHAESDELIEGRTEQLRQQLGSLGAGNWTYCRPPMAEIDAVQRALLLAQYTGCKLHIVHVSNRVCLDLAETYRCSSSPVDVTCEVCPHYVVFSAEDVVRLGVAAKCAPPIRTRPHRDLLWEGVRSGLAQVIGSDHSPAPASMKTDDFFASWGGIAGVQSTLPAILSMQPRLEIEKVSSLTSANVATRFGIRRKGYLAPGYDADLALVDLSAEYELTRDMLLDRHKLSPYVGRRFRGRIQRTYARGRLVFAEGRAVGPKGGGQLVRPLLT